MAKIVKVLKYDPVKGKGEYLTEDRMIVPFRHNQLKEIIPNRSLAKLTRDGMLTRKIGRLAKFLWLVRRMLKWRL